MQSLLNKTEKCKHSVDYAKEETYIILWLELFHNQKYYGYASVADGCIYNRNKYKQSKSSRNLITLGSHTKLFILELSI